MKAFGAQLRWAIRPRYLITFSSKQPQHLCGEHHVNTLKLQR